MFWDKWAKLEARNILSAANLALLQSAFGSLFRDNVVFGFHYYYAGGCSHTDLASRSAVEILREIEASRPGDHFTLYSLAHIAEFADAVLPVDPASPESVESLLEDLRRRSVNTELVVVFATPAPHIDVLWNLDDRDLDDLRSEWASIGCGKGEVFVFRMDVLDEAADGSKVLSVTPPRLRIHALLDAKRPTPDGRTPRSGPY